jgi:signal transduction histidine kinase
MGRNGELIGQILLLHDVTEQKRAQTRILEQQSVVVMLRERECLARELHDGIGQMLASAQFQVKVAFEFLAKQNEASLVSCLQKLDEVIQEAKESVRTYLTGVKTHIAQENNLLSRISRYIHHYSNDYGIHTELFVPPEFKQMQLSPAIETQLQPIIQEALTNVRKHSGSGSVRVIFTFGDGEFLIKVIDDGKGFDADGISENTGFGLLSMRGRAKEAGASLEIESVPGKGTCVIVRVPWRKEKS